MLAEQYVRVEQNQEATDNEVITEVHFGSDYDVTDILKRWGNWSRKDHYERSGTLSIFKSQKKEYKETLSDDDALIIDSILSSMSKRGHKAKLQREVLKLFYFGEEMTIKDYVASTGLGKELGDMQRKKSVCVINFKDFLVQEKTIIKPLSVVEIAKKLDLSRAKVTSLKEGGENHIIGHLSALTLSTGSTLDILKDIRYIR